MADEEAIDKLDAPETCEVTTEYDNGIEEGFEIEPDDQRDLYRAWGDVEQQFVQFERSYRARRIRELTMGSLIKRGRGRRQRRLIV